MRTEKKLQDYKNVFYKKSLKTPKTNHDFKKKWWMMDKNGLQI